MCKEFLLNLQNSFKGVYSSYYRLTKGLLPTCTRVVSLLLLLTTIGVGNAWGAIASGTYVLCTSTSDLEAGAHYIIANGTSGTVNCISNVSNSNNRKTVSASVSSSKITVAANSTIMTFTLGGSSGAWTFYTDNYAGTAGYLASATSGDYNYCRVISTSTTGTISFSDNAAVINLQPHTSRTLLRYNPNNGNPVFACYSSGQNAVYLYKKEASAFTVTASSNNNSWGTVSVSGTTITATPADCYQVASGTDGYSLISGSASAITHTSNSNTISVTPTANCSIQVVFEKQTVNTYVDEIQGNADIENCGTHDAPSLDDEDVASSGTCAQQHWHFMGWVTSANKANPTDLNIIAAGTEMTANGTIYYAVWAKGSSGGSVFDSYVKVTSAPANWTTDKYVLVCTSESKILTGKASGGNYGDYATFDAVTEYADYELTIATTETANYYSITIGGKYLSLTSNGNNLYFADSYTANDGSYNKCDWQLYNSSSEFIVESPIKYTISNNSTWRAIRYNKTSGQERFACYKYDTQEKCVLYKRTTTTGYTYSDYKAVCCNELGTINGSVSWSNAATAVVSWDNLDHVSSWTVKYKTHAAGAYTTWEGAQSTADGRRSVTITGLTPCTNYDFQIIANPASGYCDKDQTIEDSQTHNWTVTSTGVTNVSPASAIPSTTCDGFSIASMSPASGYHLPANITVTNADYTWNSSTGALTISNVEGNVTITIEGEENSCSDYSFHSGGADVWNTRAENKCFSLVSGTLWSVDYTIASYSNYCVNYQGGKYSTGGSNNVSFATAAWSDMKFWERTFTVGAATGAKGKLKIYSDSYTTNLGVGFEPDGYGITYGGAGYAFATTATPNKWETDVVELPNVGSTTYTMGLATATEGTYVTCSHSSAAENINVMGMSSVEGGLRKIWLYSTANSWIGSNAKMAIWDVTNEHWGNNTTDTKFMTKANDNLWYGYVPTSATTIILVRVDPANDDPAWGWGQSYDVTPSDVNNYITITGTWSNDVGDNNKSKAEYTIGSTHPETGMNGKFRMWDNSGDNNWHVHFVPYYKLTYNANGGSNAPVAVYGSSESTNNVTVNNGSGLTPPTGKHFVKWNTADDGTGIDVAAGSFTLTEDLEIFAIYDWDNYTVTVNKSGCASATVDADKTTSVHYGETITLSADEPSGYAFVNWTTSDGVTFSPNATTKGATFTMPTNNVTVTANYVQAHTVTWYVNDDEWTSGVNAGNSIVIDGQKIVSLPTAPTKSDCDDSKVFVGWKAAEISGTSVSDPGGIFTTQAGSPVISAKTDFYAVFADGNEETKSLTNSEIQTFHTADATNHGNYKKGPFTLPSTDGNWYGIFATQNNSGTYTANIKSDAVDLETDDVTTTYTPYLMSPTYSANINKITILATHGSNSSRTLYVCSAATADPASDNIGSITVVKDNDTPQEIIPSSSVTTLYLYASGGAIMIKNIDVNIGSPSNYVTSCASCIADATYTNTTPSVSEIGCTTATLTMEDGLATLGAAGCNISDYGFVIGTADNPAIGGGGVTKLQVGTSNPTTGEDFSYDVTGLTKGTHYYIRAYATNRHGTAYSTNSENFWTKDVSSIAITTAPTKTNYIVGETFDATGMVVTATMASSGTENVTSDVTYSTDALTAGASQNFAINYSLCETETSVNQVINVYTLTVSAGTNPTYGTHSVDGAVITVTPNAQKTFTLVPTNAQIRDNGNSTYTVINPTGNVSVVINYRDAAQVKVYYRVDGVEITGLTQDVYESSQTTLPTASALASAMASQGMDLPDELYPNFVGWSETEFSAQTEDPTLVTGTPTINAPKSYYAVYSNVNIKRILPSDFSNSYGSAEDKIIDGVTYYKSNVCTQSSMIQFKTTPGYLYTKDALAYIKKIEITGLDLVVNACSDNAGTIDGAAITPTGTAPYEYTFPAHKSYAKITGKGGTDKVSSIYIYYASATVYYMTQFCDRYDITGASTSGTAVIVNGNTGGTLTSSHNALCEGKSLTLSAAVNTQYSFGEWKIIKTGVEPEVDVTSTLLGANKTSLTPPAFSMPGYGITVSATISEKTATAWSWTYNSGAIPNPMTLYVGEVKQLDVTYTPDASQLVTAQKNYTVTKESSVAEVAKAGTYYKMRGAAGVTEETNTTVTFSLNSLSQVVNVTVKPLPSARFEDNVHNAVSTTVTATVSDGVVALTQKTPTHADISPAPTTANNCENTHLHLVGWIDGEWEPYITYINGGSRPLDSDITSATGYFYLPNADINLSEKGGHTYYAVWGKADE